jgi:hypothetical protein
MPLCKKRSPIAIATCLHSLTSNHTPKCKAIALASAIKSYSPAHGPRLFINKYSNSSRLRLRVNGQINAKYYIKA